VCPPSLRGREVMDNLQVRQRMPGVKGLVRNGIESLQEAGEKRRVARRGVGSGRTEGRHVRGT